MKFGGFIFLVMRTRDQRTAYVYITNFNYCTSHIIAGGRRPTTIHGERGLYLHLYRRLSVCRTCPFCSIVVGIAAVGCCKLLEQGRFWVFLSVAEVDMNRLFAQKERKHQGQVNDQEPVGGSSSSGGCQDVRNSGVCLSCSP